MYIFYADAAKKAGNEPSGFCFLGIFQSEWIASQNLRELLRCVGWIGLFHGPRH